MSGNRVGSIDGQATVRFRTRDGTAINHVDYEQHDIEVVFPDRITTQTVSVKVLKDNVPELQETFMLELYSPSDNVILSEQNTVIVYIVKNGDPHGVIGINSTGHVNNTFLLDEDSQNTVLVPVFRTQGSFGNISVKWSISSSQLISKDLTSVFDTTNATLFFKENQTVAYINIVVLMNEIPAEAEMFTLRLSDIVGGGRLTLHTDGMFTSSVNVLVKDSDDAYGVVGFDHTKPTIIMV
jgi:Calx-beta domain.